MSLRFLMLYLTSPDNSDYHISTFPNYQIQNSSFKISLPLPRIKIIPVKPVHEISTYQYQEIRKEIFCKRKPMAEHICFIDDDRQHDQ